MCHQDHRDSNETGMLMSSPGHAVGDCVYLNKHNLHMYCAQQRKCDLLFASLFLPVASECSLGFSMWICAHFESRTENSLIKRNARYATQLDNAEHAEHRRIICLQAFTHSCSPPLRSTPKLASQSCPVFVDPGPAKRYVACRSAALLGSRLKAGGAAADYSYEAPDTRAALDSNTAHSVSTSTLLGC